MLTDQDIIKLKSVFATKEDLANFATKDDLAKFSTKDDLTVFATKEDLSYFATKQDIQELKEDIEGLRELIQALYVSTDTLIKSIGELTAEYKAISVQLSRHDNWIKQIAEKIGLELKMD